MPVRQERQEEYGALYRLRVLGCVIAAQLLLLALVRWWPLPSLEKDTTVYHTQGQELIAIEEIMPTRQKQKPPPPPPPLVPVVVPDDVVLEDVVEIDENVLMLEEYADAALDQTGPQTGDAASFQAPEVGPKPLRFVEPEYTRAARRRNIRAEVIVEVLVDEKGLVRDARVVERFLYNNENDEKEVVSALDYGLEEAALAAAQRWMFQPAKQNGQPVRSYTTLTFSFGV